MTIVSTTTSPIDNNHLPRHSPTQHWTITRARSHSYTHQVRSSWPPTTSSDIDRTIHIGIPIVAPDKQVIIINRSSNSLYTHVDINHVTRGQHEHV